MSLMKKGSEMIFVASLILAFLASFPPSATGQNYPTKPITIYCGYAPGGATDITARALASGAEKLLGVPVVVENKPGGGATVAATLLASKNPDGYTVAFLSGGALSIGPHISKLNYNALKDFTFIMQYSRYIAGLCVLSSSPIKTIDEFIAYAKAHPGLSYGSGGMLTAHHLGTEIFMECKGLSFKHVPFKGGAPASTALLGKHTDFVIGTGQHINYVKQGIFRLLLLLNTDKRDPTFPNVPTLREIGCGDVPTQGYIVVGPKGIPATISKKLDETFKRVAEGPAFQNLMGTLSIPYDYMDGVHLEKEIFSQYEWFRTFLQKMGVKKSG